MSILESLLFGLRLPYESARLIVRSPALILWSALPLVLTAAAAIWIIDSLQITVHGRIIHAFVSSGWNPQGSAAGLLIFLSRILLVIAGALVFSFSAAIIAAPFNDFLAEKAEALSNPPLPSAGSTPWTARIKLIRIDIAKSLAAACGAATALLFSWMPVVNFFVFVITFLLITFQFVSYPQTRRQEGIGDGLSFLLKHFWASLAFGAVTSFLFAIPVISILALPVSVVGGTLLFARARGDANLPRLR